MGIGEKLRSRRLEMDLSRSQLAKKVHVTPSAIANYENGVSYPKPDILISLIIALEVDANYLYQDYLPHGSVTSLFGKELSEEETDAVAKYRNLSDSGKHLVRTVINEEYNRTLKEEWISFPCYRPGIRKLNCGFLWSDDPATFRIKKKHLIEGTDFCFQIQLDQYEPVFKRYDVLALQKRPAAHNEMGIFRLDDICYIRTLSLDGPSPRLYSFNMTEPDIEVPDPDRLECIGTILRCVPGTFTF